MGTRRRRGRPASSVSLQAGSHRLRRAGCGRQLHRSAETDEQRVGTRTTPRTGRSRSKVIRSSTETKAAASRLTHASEDREVEGEQAKCDGGSDHLDHQYGEGTRLLSADTRTVCMSIISLSVST